MNVDNVATAKDFNRVGSGHPISIMEENKNNLPAITVEMAKAQMNIALTKMSESMQALSNAAKMLVFNEDGVGGISDFLAKCKKFLKIIDEAHKEGKAPHLAACKSWDEGKKDLYAVINEFYLPVNDKHQKICAEIEQRRVAEEQRLAKEKAILDGIEGNIITFSQKIAAAETTDDLLSVERLINLEKSESRKAKYGDHHALAITRYDEVLIPILKSQKDKIKQKEALEKQLKAADDANVADNLTEKLDEINNEILQNRVYVQQAALTVPDSFEITPSEQLYPETKGRNNFKFEIVDLAVAVKKSPELLDVTIKTRDAQRVAMAFRDAGVFNGKTEAVVNGIKYSIEKTYK